ncbi:MAG: 30S ribosomal protein S16 [Actinomycetia bacterium]|nr:30S ribosomal protein S16 [Actinomycetes bacterium]
MSVKIRLARHGAKKAPFYRVVVADERKPRDGRFIEIVGRYNPRLEPSGVELNMESVDAWLAKGAQPTEAAAKLIEIARGDKKPVEVEKKLSKRQLAKQEAEAEEAAAAKEAAEEPEAPAEEPEAPAEEPEAPAEAEEAAAEEPAAEEPAAEE